VGNGLFYGASVEPDLSFTGFSQQMIWRAEDGFHPIHVNAYQPAGSPGTADVRFGAGWVRDDDSAFPYGYGVVTTVAQLQAEELAQQPLRPISLSGYKTSPNESRFAVAYLHDDSGYPWQLILDRDFDQYQAEIVALAGQGFRPICVSGYSFDGVNPRYSGIFVQDGLTGSDWVTSHGIPESDYQSWSDGWWDDGFRPISLSGYTVGNETFFTAVMVRVPGSGGYVARHGLTENEFLAENANWINPANNEYNTAFRPVVVAAYRSGGNAGPKRYTAVWRGSAPRAFAANGPTQPSLAALDTAMQNFMQSRDINAATLCVSKDGGIVHHRGYNWSPGEFKETQPCSRFRIASASKAVTGVAVMKLLEGNIITGMKGGGLQALTLDTPVFQINGMPNLPAAYGADAQNITIRHLLQHSAGWDRTIFEPLYSDLTVAAALGQNLPMSRQDMIDYMMTPGIWPMPGDSISVGFPGLLPPGTISAYSNFGFSILAELIEVISNQSYENYLRTEILLPVNANRTRLGRTARLLALNGPDEVTYTAGGGTNDAWYVSDSNYSPGAPGIPTSQSRVGLSEPGAAFPTTAYGRYNIHTIDAAGGWVTTSDDMVRLLKSFDAYDPAQLNSDTPLLDWDSIWEMWSNPANITQVVGNNYVLGWQQATLNTPSGNVTVLFHGGNVDGAMSVIGRRSDGVTFAAMVSREAGSGLFTALNNAINSITSWPVCPDGTIVNYTPPIATDNDDANVSVVCVPPSGSYFPIGFHSVTCTATDDCGNERTCQFRVTVKVDNTPPSIQCPSNRIVWTCSTDGAVVNFPAATVDDDTDPSPSVVCVPPSGSLFPVGRSVVTCTATDDCTNRSTCTFTVTVNADIVPPVIDCPSNIVLQTCYTNAITHYAVTATDNHDANVAILCTPPLGTPLPVGTTTVNCVAEDDCGNTSQCSFDVQILRDTTPPVIACPTDLHVWTCSNSVPVSYSVSATDAESANVAIICTPPSGSVFPVGTTTIACAATDECDNRTTCTFTVTVSADTAAPVIECPSILTVITCTNYAVVHYGVNATDDCDTDVDIVCTPPSGSTLPLGETTVTCIARDDCGRTATCSFSVTVRQISLRLTITATAGGVTLVWTDPDAALEEADDVTGPWRVDPDARSPHPVPASRAQRFFRLAVRGDRGETQTFCPDGEETNPRLTDVLSRMHYASTHVREEFEEYEDVSEEPVTVTPVPRDEPYDPRPGGGYSWNSAEGRRFLLDIGDVGEDREGAASHTHGSVEWQIMQAVDTPTCVTPDYYVEAGDRNFSGWSDATFKAPKNAFATKAEAEAFLLKIHAEQPFFLPFTDPNVKLGHGWYYNSGKLHRACDYSRSGVEEDEDPTFLVTSAGSGVVVATDWDGNGGNYVAVESTAPGGQKVMFIYLHLRDGKSHDIAKAKSSTSNDEKYVKYRAFANDYPDHLSWGTESHTIKVNVGDPVSIGTPLAWAGNTGAGGAGSGLNEDGSPKNWKGNTHLHVYVAVPHPTLADTWVWVDPYGVYQEVDTGCYDLLKDTKFSRLYAPFYSTFHGVPYEVFKFYWGYYPNMGRKLRTLSIHRDGNSLLASGSFQSGIPGGWYLHTYRTIDEFQDLATLRYQQGYIMRETTVEKTLGGQPRFSAIWRPLEPGESIEHRAQLTDAQWSDLWQDRVVDEEWRLEDYFGYSVAGVNYQSAFVTSYEGRPFLYSGLLSSSALDDKIDEYKADGYLPVSFNAANRTGGLRFSGIFRDLPGCWKVRWGLTPAGYQSYVSQQIQLGYRVWKVQGYSNSDRYGVVLHDPTGPCQ
jgi:CubicO group peptidase (beta-lactamase class C family)